MSCGFVEQARLYGTITKNLLSNLFLTIVLWICWFMGIFHRGLWDRLVILKCRTENQSKNNIVHTSGSKSFQQCSVEEIYANNIGKFKSIFWCKMSFLMSSCEFTIWILMNLIDLVVRLDDVLT